MITKTKELQQVKVFTPHNTIKLYFKNIFLEDGIEISIVDEEKIYIGIENKDDFLNEFNDAYKYVELINWYTPIDTTVTEVVELPANIETPTEVII